MYIHVPGADTLDPWHREIASCLGEGELHGGRETELINRDVFCMTQLQGYESNSIPGRGGTSWWRASPELYSRSPHRSLPSITNHPLSLPEKQSPSISNWCLACEVQRSPILTCNARGPACDGRGYRHVARSSSQVVVYTWYE